MHCDTCGHTPIVNTDLNAAIAAAKAKAIEAQKTMAVFVESGKYKCIAADQSVGLPVYGYVSFHP